MKNKHAQELARLKKGVKEKPSEKKRKACRENMRKALEKRWGKPIKFKDECE